MGEQDCGGRRESTARLDLDRMTVQDLTALIEAAEAKRRDKQEEARVMLLAKWRAEAIENGLRLETMFGQQKQDARKVYRGGADKVPVKFKGPNGEEWSGRGRSPKWIVDAERQGKSREEFLIKNDVQFDPISKSV
jgi:DNA-binding protein H-NS